MGTNPTVQDNSAFLGADVTTETLTETPEEVTGTETPAGEAEEASVEQPEPEETETTEAVEPEEAEEELRVVLPKEQAKQYSKALMGHYAKRLGVNPEDLEGNQALQKAVKQLIDKDIYVQQLKGNQPEIDSEDAEEAGDQPQPSLDEHLESVLKESSELNDPKFMEAFTKKLEGATSVPEQVQILTAGMHNYLKTVLPKMLGDIQAAHTAQQNEIVSAHEKAYNSLKETNLDLPEFNSAEFWTLYNSALEVVPKLNDAVFTPQERFDTVVRIAQGRKLSAAVVEKATESGKKQAKKEQQTAQLGKGLGAGTSKTNQATGKEDKGLSRGHAIWKERESNSF